MSFDSFEFLIFLPIVISLYWMCPYKKRWVLLLGASYYFYMSWNVTLALLMFTVSIVSYLSGILISRAENQRIKRLWFVLALIICIGLLIFFKYFNFLTENISVLLHFFGLKSDIIVLDIILPVGISFYTFQAFSYVIDVYRDRLEPEHHFGFFMLYVSFFPQLVAGPIERTENLMPQLKSRHYISSDDMHGGVRLLLSGFFRKIVVADFVGTFVTSVYANSSEIDGGAVFVGTILFSVQIYCDFQGYSEIAAGCARLMGIRLMKNFDRPYSAHSIREFWRRWHISLTTWFTDYIYKPIGGSHKGKPRRIIATFVVFLVSGLWHGAAWTFVVWGMIHAFYLIMEILLQKPLAAFTKHKSGGMTAKVRGLAAVIGTFCLVNFAWIFFRAETLGQAFSFIRKLFSPWSLINTVESLNIQIIDVAQLLIILFMLPALNYLTDVSTWIGEIQIGRTQMGESLRGETQAGETQAGEIQAGEIQTVETQTFKTRIGEIQIDEIQIDEIQIDELQLDDKRIGKTHKREAHIKRNTLAMTYVYFIMVIVLSWLIRLEQNGASTFIYFQF